MSRLQRLRKRLSRLAKARSFRRARTLYWRRKWRNARDPRKRGRYLQKARDSADLLYEIGKTQRVLKQRIENIKARQSAQSVPDTPKEIIDKVVVPIAQKCGISVTASSITQANGRHGTTVTGNRSDHQGPPDQAWAADLSNGSSPTPGMDRLARELAKRFGLPWDGSGIVNGYSNGFRYQMIYRSDIGGNHWNHVHFGCRRV